MLSRVALAVIWARAAEWALCTRALHRCQDIDTLEFEIASECDTKSVSADRLGIRTLQLWGGGRSEERIHLPFAFAVAK